MQSQVLSKGGLHVSAMQLDILTVLCPGAGQPADVSAKDRHLTFKALASLLQDSMLAFEYCCWVGNAATTMPHTYCCSIGWPAQPVSWPYEPFFVQRFVRVTQLQISNALDACLCNAAWKRADTFLMSEAENFRYKLWFKASMLGLIFHA